ncbi:MAG: hypothetical protein HC850_10675 [Rhodomicrobium sp.]|nr:hypothetical protein [Rhodomicrobium sp.]
MIGSYLKKIVLGAILAAGSAYLYADAVHAKKTPCRCPTTINCNNNPLPTVCKAGNCEGTQGNYGLCVKPSGGGGGGEKKKRDGSFQANPK